MIFLKKTLSSRLTVTININNYLLRFQSLVWLVIDTDDTDTQHMHVSSLIVDIEIQMICCFKSHPFSFFLVLMVVPWVSNCTNLNDGGSVCRELFKNLKYQLKSNFRMKDNQVIKHKHLLKLYFCEWSFI